MAWSVVLVSVVGLGAGTAAAYLGATLGPSALHPMSGGAPSASLPSSCNVTLNFDSINTTSVQTRNATPYLASFGIAVTSVTPGQMVEAMGNSAYLYGAVQVPSMPNVLTESGPANTILKFTLNFPVPLASLQFTRPYLIGNGSSGLIFPQWSATAYNGTSVVKTVGESLRATYSNVPARVFSFSGPITSLKFRSNGQSIAAFSAVLIDNLKMGSPAFCTTKVTFTEKGLASGSVWNVSVQGLSGYASSWFAVQYPKGLTLSTTLGSIQFTLPSGTYDWETASLYGGPTVGSGSFSVVYGTSQTIPIAWT